MAAMTALDYFKAKADAYISPMGLKAMMDSDPDSLVVVDVRSGPRLTKIKGAIDMPEAVVTERAGELPKDKLVVLYCWETWCSLATKAAIPLLETGFRVKEMYGGIAAWEVLGMPTEAAGGAKPASCAC
jgi:rhodanese-related sulfurtransferase